MYLINVLSGSVMTPIAAKWETSKKGGKSPNQIVIECTAIKKCLFVKIIKV